MPRRCKGERPFQLLKLVVAYYRSPKGDASHGYKAREMLQAKEKGLGDQTECGTRFAGLLPSFKSTAQTRETKPRLQTIFC